MKRIGKTPYSAGVKKKRRWLNYPNTLSVCLWTLLTVISNAIIVRIRLLRSLKGTFRSYYFNIYGDQQRIRSNVSIRNNSFLPLLLQEKMQAMCYNATLRRFDVNIVAVESSQCYVLWECVCSLSYPACNAHTPYCYLWPARL